MKKRYIASIFLSLLFFASMFLFGCKHDTIKFYRESAASKLLNPTASKPKANVNSGIIILRDESTQETINFGPRDINFDLPVRFK